MEFWGLALLSILGFTLNATCTTINRGFPRNIEARSSWTFLGCYTDNVSGRALPNGETGGSNAMTNELCQSNCLQAGFSIAGTEYGGECCNFTSSSFTSSSTSTKLSSSFTTSSSTSFSTSPLPTSSGTVGTGKRGLAYTDGNPDGNAAYANLFVGYPKISWGYDWGYPSQGLDPYFEFVPMLWGLPSGSDPSWTAAVQTTGTKNILGFNEPDLKYSGSSNILPAKAAAGYQSYMQPFAGSVKIGMPNVLWNNMGSSSGGSYDSAVWTQYFFGNCTGCHFDFAAIHYYQDCNPSNSGQTGAAWFQGNVTNAYETLGLPVWITEFQCYGSDAQQVAFLQQVLPWLDAQSYVQRYAYFGTFPGHTINANGTGLSDIGVAYATT
ncbi:glycoside hydrolase family 128 protein [Stipitochalara longipes BDJ]|nr:glycoside hydrolase family 128 protein [Stipitochalara longipes BDJ]